MNYLGGRSLITRILIKGKQEGQSQIEDMMDAEVREERFTDAMLLGLKVERGYNLKK